RAMTYQIQLALNEGGAAFSDIVLDQQGVTGTSFPLPNLENGRIYVWRVRANNDGGAGEWSDTRGFITEAGGSTQVDTEFPDQGAQNIPVDPTEFGWLQVPGAESYHIQISRQNTFVVNRIDQQGITDTTFTTDDLDPNTLYFWRIKASNAGAANWSPTLNFTTGGLTPAPPPLRSPNDNAVGLPRTVQLVWASVADNPTYTVQVALDEQFSQPVAGASGLSDTTFTATSLDFNRRYFWRVQGVNDKGSGEWSAVRSFSTLDLAPPATPVQFAPANGAANASPQPSFGWNAATGADRYQIEISTQTNFATLVLSEETQETTFRPANVALQLSQSYFWRVRALNDAGEGVSNIWSFTVTATNVGIEQEEGVPTETTLQAAYPNPFRGQTRIGVDVAEPGDVTVQVYDVQGRQVAELIRTRLTAGRYSTVWDASDVPAGLYLVRLTTPDTDRVQRVVKVQ
ncbi:MAG: T9SS type A sorting domain-containing protein, partial [Bacteroidota bacterium]